MSRTRSRLDQGEPGFAARNHFGGEGPSYVGGGELDAIIGAWHEHLVLLFRGQTITDEELARFSRLFGALDEVPSSKNSKVKMYVPGMPEVVVVSNVIEDGIPIGALGAGEAEWHTDMSYVETPPAASILCAIEVPAGQGHTYFANMYKAYESLPSDLGAAIDGRVAAHDASHNSAGELRAGFSPVANVRDVIGARHPIARPHPVTGRLAIYLGRRMNGYVEGLEVDDSEHLLDRLWAHCTEPENVWHHEWRVDDVLMWDNRCTIHRRDAFDQSTRRIMHRTQIRTSYQL